MTLCKSQVTFQIYFLRCKFVTQTLNPELQGQVENIIIVRWFYRLLSAQSRNVMTMELTF